MVIEKILPIIISIPVPLIHHRRNAKILECPLILQRVATGDGLTSRKRFGRAAPKEALAGDSRFVQADLDRVGKENPAVFP